MGQAASMRGLLPRSSSFVTSLGVGACLRALAAASGTRRLCVERRAQARSPRSLDSGSLSLTTERVAPPRSQARAPCVWRHQASRFSSSTAARGAASIAARAFLTERVAIALVTALSTCGRSALISITSEMLRPGGAERAPRREAIPLPAPSLGGAQHQDVARVMLRT
jgi:hypothetical protein